VSYMPQVGERKLFLFARLFQEELGRLPCALARYMSGCCRCIRVLTDICSLSTRPYTKQAVMISCRWRFQIISNLISTAAFYNPFPKFDYTGSLRPVYPLSPKRTVPPHISRPDYAEDGNPKSERKFLGRNNINILDKKQQEGMRKVCRLAREVLDIAAREVRPGVTTDYLDEVVHKACIERNVCTRIISGSRTMWNNRRHV